MQIVREKDNFLIIKLDGLRIGTIERMPQAKKYHLNYIFGGIQTWWEFSEKQEMFDRLKDRIWDLHDELVTFLESEGLRIEDNRAHADNK